MTASVILSSSSDQPLALSAEELQRVVQAVLAYEEIRRPVELSVVVANEKAMAELNGTYRGVAAPTDVLALELERPDDPSLAEGELCCLGDLILCPSFIQAQAERYGVSSEDETRLLAIHGILHLLGFDHESAADAASMERAQNGLVAQVTEGRLPGVSLGPHEDDLS